MKSNSFLVGLFIGIIVAGIVAFFYIKNQSPFVPFNTEWYTQKDSLGGAIQKDNYFFAVRKGAQTFTPDRDKMLPIDSSLATEMLLQYDKIMKDAKIDAKTTYSIDLPAQQVLGYLAAVGNADLSKLGAIRFYIGAYPKDQDTGHLKDRMSIFVVAVGKDGKELYDNRIAAQQIQDMGGLCPTHCPTKTDAKAIINLAKLNP